MHWAALSLSRGADSQELEPSACDAEVQLQDLGQEACEHEQSCLQE